MKTTSQTIRSFPKPVKFSLYVGAIVVLCFFNWVALHAEGPAKSLENRLAAALVEEVEAEIEIQDWMLSFSDDFLTAAETEIILEPWMLTFSDDYLVKSETEISVEPWMTSTFLWDTVYLLARK